MPGQRISFSILGAGFVDDGEHELGKEEGPLAVRLALCYCTSSGNRWSHD